jgi:Alpha-galactosidase
MKRRNFIKTCTYTAAGAMFMTEASSKLFAEAFPAGMNTPVTYNAVKGTWKINNDGTFDLSTSQITLKGCFPSFDGKTIKPVGIKTERKANGGRIIYTLTDGKIILTFSDNKGVLTLDSVLDGIDTAPHWFAPLSEATVTGADRYFKQGNGFGGPSGVFEYAKPPIRRETPQNNESWSIDSYLTTGLISPEGETIAVAPYKFDNYVCRSTHRNRTYRKGLIDRHLDTNINLFEIAFATENIKLKSKATTLPTIYFLAGESAYPTFRQLAGQMAVANGITELRPPVYGWCSWYEFEHDFNQSILEETIDGLKSQTPPIPLQMIQVDDGYSPHGDWIIPNSNFAKGLDHLAATITKAGYRAGIWVGPFMVMETSEVFKNHPDWILKDNDGNMIKSGLFRGITDYILDTSHPEAFEHLRKVFHTLRSWGFTYYKTDFLDWGLNDSTAIKRYKPGKTSAQYYTEVMNMIREEIGADSFWLACIAPYQQMLGFADGLRFSNDVSGLRNAINNMVPETIACQYFNGVLYLNDPDTMFLRDFNETKYADANDKTGFKSSVAAMSTDERESIALWDGMTSNYITTSDRFHTSSDDMVSMFRFLKPGDKYLPTEHIDWDKPSVIKNALRKLPNGDYAFLVLNASNERQKVDMPISKILPMDSSFVFRWSYNKRIPMGKQSNIVYELKPYMYALFYLSQKNIAPSKKMTIYGVE